MRGRDLMTARPITVIRNADAEARRQMVGRIRHLVVVEDGRGHRHRPRHPAQPASPATSLSVWSELLRQLTVGGVMSPACSVDPDHRPTPPAS
jgi:hypothetical protein